VSTHNSGGWGNLAVFFALLTLAAVAVNARAGWLAETRKEKGAAFATPGGPILVAGTGLTGLCVLSARRLGGHEAMLGGAAGVLLAVAVLAHASLLMAALTCRDPSDEPRPFELVVTQ
jgi:hypothetical protein